MKDCLMTTTTLSTTNRHWSTMKKRIWTTATWIYSLTLFRQDRSTCILTRRRSRRSNGQSWWRRSKSMSYLQKLRVWLTCWIQIRLLLKFTGLILIRTTTARRSTIKQSSGRSKSRWRQWTSMRRLKTRFTSRRKRSCSKPHLTESAKCTKSRYKGCRKDSRRTKSCLDCLRTK